MSALQRKLGSASVERKRREEEDPYRNWDSPWPPGYWQRAEAARANGTWKPRPPTRYPFLLTPEGPVSSAAQVQELAGMETAPEVIITRQVHGITGADQGGPDVTVCDISREEWEQIEEKAAEFDTGGLNFVVLFHGKDRAVRSVSVLKEGIVLGGIGSQTDTEGVAEGNEAGEGEVNDERDSERGTSEEQETEGDDQDVTHGDVEDDTALESGIGGIEAHGREDEGEKTHRDGEMSKSSHGDQLEEDPEAGRDKDDVVSEGESKGMEGKVDKEASENHRLSFVHD